MMPLSDFLDAQSLSLSLSGPRLQLGIFLLQKTCNALFMTSPAATPEQTPLEIGFGF
jgi:hypothetical protein